jgi:hypothetical protein
LSWLVGVVVVQPLLVAELLVAAALAQAAC